MISPVFIALGANLGDRLRTLEAARAGLRVFSTVEAHSSIIETPALLPPEDPRPQPAYLNQVVQVRTELEPRALLKSLKWLESELGRQPAPRWAPRLIDLDLIFYGTLVLTDGPLTVPHPEAHRRRFVLEPLMELAPNFLHPVEKLTVTALLASLPRLPAQPL